MGQGITPSTGSDPLGQGICERLFFLTLATRCLEIPMGAFGEHKLLIPPAQPASRCILTLLTPSQAGFFFYCAPSPSEL